MVAGKLDYVNPEYFTEGEVDDFLISENEELDIPVSENYKLIVTDNSRCNYLCGSKGLEEDMNQQKAKSEYINTDDPCIDYNIVQQEKVDKELEVSKQDSLSFMNVKTLEEGEAWYRKNFPQVPDELYPIMARWNWGDLQDVTKKSIKQDKKRIARGKKPKVLPGLQRKEGSFVVEF